MRRAALLIAALAVLAGGCSRVSLAWRFAPWMLTGEAADMLGVADEQRPELRRDVEAGAPVNPDGTINLVHYAAWLVKEMAARGD